VVAADTGLALSVPVAGLMAYCETVFADHGEDVGALAVRGDRDVVRAGPGGHGLRAQRARGRADAVLRDLVGLDIGHVEVLAVGGDLDGSGVGAARGGHRRGR
jgi:hypothetical protein